MINNSLTWHLLIVFFSSLSLSLCSPTYMSVYRRWENVFGNLNDWFSCCLCSEYFKRDFFLCWGNCKFWNTYLKNEKKNTTIASINNYFRLLFIGSLFEWWQHIRATKKGKIRASFSSSINIFFLSL